MIACLHHSNDVLSQTRGNRALLPGALAGGYGICPRFAENAQTFMLPPSFLVTEMYLPVMGCWQSKMTIDVVLLSSTTAQRLLEEAPASGGLLSPTRTTIASAQENGSGGL